MLKRKHSDDGVHIVPCEAGPLVQRLGHLVGTPMRFKRQPFVLLKRRWRYISGQKLRRTGLPHAKPLNGGQ